ncbi:MAG: guanylate kinase [Pseudomonadota bacterium]
MNQQSETSAVHTLQRRGIMLILSSPSGAGKTSLARDLLAHDQRFHLSVSVTTRTPRPGECDGSDYRFIGRDAFLRMVQQNELLEHAEVFGHLYGTPRKPVEQALDEGRDLLFDIDWQGTQQLAQKMPNDMIRVFLLPPSRAELARRLQSRAQDSPDVVVKRMAEADLEMSHWPEYDWILINEDRQVTLTRLCAIVASERERRHRQLWISEFVNHLCK